MYKIEVLVPYDNAVEKHEYELMDRTEVTQQLTYRFKLEYTT